MAESDCEFMAQQSKPTLTRQAASHVISESKAISRAARLTAPEGAVVIVKIINGLGNQLFQYAFGRRTAWRIRGELKLDASGFQNYSLRSYRLGHFNIVEQFASTDEVMRVSGLGIGGTAARARRLLQKCLPRHRRCYVKERGMEFEPALRHIAQSVYLDGYWQCEEYFLDIADVIRDEFTFKHDPDDVNLQMLKRIQGSNSVNLHVRRGDYVADQKTSRIHGTCPLEYYRAAVETLVRHEPNPQFFVFSDDMNWARRHLRLDYPTVYVDHNGAERDYEDLRLMSACRHHIIANSSFSWWGAWLCDNPGKIVVAPKVWFADSTWNSRDIVPQSWWRL